MPSRDADVTAQLESLAANVRRERERLGFTQESLAEHAALDYGWVRKLERGVVDLRIQTLVRIAKALNTTPSRLLRTAKLQPRRPGRPGKRVRAGVARTSSPVSTPRR
jgi:transcriptional regulator with XRE-family HTH domain